VHALRGNGAAINSFRQLWPLLKQAGKGWIEDRAASMGAALAYYAAFSVGPLLIIAIAIASLFFGRDSTQEAIVAQVQALLGTAGGAAIRDILQSSGDFGSGIVALVVGLSAFLLGATTSFVELQDDLDRIWKVEPRAQNGIANLLRSRLLSFGMVLVVGFLLTVSLAVSAGMAALGKSMIAYVEFGVDVLTFLVSFGVITTLFATIYKFLPNARIDWANVWAGAAITALLFEFGKFAIGLYLGKSSVASSFGAAGPFVVMMLWIYYSTQIFLLGAEFTVAHAKRYPQSGRDVRAGSADVEPAAARPPDFATMTTSERPPARIADSVSGDVITGRRARFETGRRLLGASLAGFVAAFALGRWMRAHFKKVK
jgi:membrane protein